MKTERIITMLSVLCIVFSVGLVACGDSDAVNAENQDQADGDVAIQVDDEVLTKSELDKRVQTKLKPMMQRFGVQSTENLPPKLKMLKTRIKRQVINQSTTQLVLLSHAKQAGISVSDQELDEKLNEVVQQQPQISSVDQLKERLSQIGLTFEEFRGKMKDSLVIERFIDQEIGELEVTEQEARDHFEKNQGEYEQEEQIHARHILVESDSQAESDIEDIKQDIDEGESFEEMAREHSEGPSGERGGDLGTFSRGQMVPTFEEVAFGLEPGVVSDPVETKYGYHLIKVEEHIDSQPADFESAREEIMNQLEQQKRQSKMQQLVQRLKEKSTIEQNVEVSQPQQGGMPGQRPGGSPQGQTPGQTPGQ